jgi:hypothetical protein
VVSASGAACDGGSRHFCAENVSAIAYGERSGVYREHVRVDRVRESEIGAWLRCAIVRVPSLEQELGRKLWSSCDVIGWLVTTRMIISGPSSTIISHPILQTAENIT